MPRQSIRAADPAQYARVKAEQAEIDRRYFSGVLMARVCPYCKTKVEMLCRGTHGAAQLKCSACGEEVKFPPISFRLSCRS